MKKSEGEILLDFYKMFTVVYDKISYQEYYL